jgi:hypothetical protein
MRENLWCYCLLGTPQNKFYSGPGKVRARFYLDGAKGRGVTGFKGTIRTFLKVLAVHHVL